MSYKWIFKIKYNVDGFVAKHKVCLVVRGFSEVKGIDFNETIFFLAWMDSIQVVLVVEAKIEDFKVHQMDVKKVFLNGDFSKEIYM